MILSRRNLKRALAIFSLLSVCLLGWMLHEYSKQGCGADPDYSHLPQRSIVTARYDITAGTRLTPNMVEFHSTIPRFSSPDSLFEEDVRHAYNRPVNVDIRRGSWILVSDVAFEGGPVADPTGPTISAPR